MACRCVCGEVVGSGCWCLDVGMFTTHTPAVPDVFVSGRNVGALCPGRHVGFR